MEKQFMNMNSQRH